MKVKVKSADRNAQSYIFFPALNKSWAKKVGFFACILDNKLPEEE
jgi:hypothetical protein